MPNVLITIPVTITKVTTTRDKSFAVTFETQDKGTLTMEQKAQLLDLLDEYGWMGFSREDKKIDDLEIPDVKPEFKGDKSPSQRLRAVFYLNWEKGQKSEDFDSYYRRQVEKIIDKLKENLD